MKSYDKLFLTLGVVTVITAVGFGGFAFWQNLEASPDNIQQTNSLNVDTTNGSTNNKQSATSGSTATYTNGVYTKSIYYSVPHGYQNSIEVSLTIADGKISAVNAKNSSNDNESASYIDSFEINLNATVVGKTLSTTNFSRIGGASLTTAAFQQAVESIRSEAAI